MNICDKIVASYVNGNYSVCLLSDGTKVRFSNDDTFCAAFPESIDVKITNYCDANCPMCHENSSVDGEHGDLNHPFFDSLAAGTELAIGGGNPLAHPQLEGFLQRMKAQGVVCNLTVNQRHFMQQRTFLDSLCRSKLVHGVGISVLYSYSTDLQPIINFANAYPHCVIHLIAGAAAPILWQKLSNHGLKVLVLGYKMFGRGTDFANNNKMDLYCSLAWLKKEISTIAKGFASISFDNLAIEQLDVKGMLDKDFFDAHYMGDDGDFTMYVDLVTEQFALSSTTAHRHKLTASINQMFAAVKSDKQAQVN